MKTTNTPTHTRAALSLAGLVALGIASSMASSQTILAGDMDNFASQGDPEDTLTISSLLSQWMARTNGNNDAYHNGNPMPFDEASSSNWDFGYTFENISLSDGALLRIHLRSNIGSLNDVVKLQYTGDGTDNSFLWGNGITDLNGGTWSTGEDAIFEIPLDNLPNTGQNIVPDINAAGYLDVWVADDTGVDWIELTIPAPGSIALLGLGGLANLRRRRR